MLNNEIDKLTHANKHAARFIAILSLYSDDVCEGNKENLSKIAKKMTKAYFTQDIFDFKTKEDIELHHPDEQLLEQLIFLAKEKQQDIEQLISSSLIEKYNFNRLDKVIKSILQLAALELLYNEIIPAKIIIDEYVSLTKSFYENNEAGFVNKVIDIMARSVRPTEI